MTCALGTRRGSADSTPSTSVQMCMALASSKEPNTEAEKSLPLRPRVVCMPCGVLAIKPVMTSVPAKPSANCPANCWRDTSHCTPGPSGPHSTTTQRRASSQRTLASLPRRCAR